MDKKQIWQAALGRLELTLSKANFATWFKNTFIIEIVDNEEHVILATPHAFAQAWLSKKYHKDILNSLQEVSDGKIKKITYEVSLVGDEKTVAKYEQQNRSSTQIQQENFSSQNKIEKKESSLGVFNLNPKYTFDTFIVGKNNELAYAAARGVAEFPGEKFNPLFIYGGVGIGKTHLAQGIGNEIIKNSADKKILYITSERFTNDYVDAIKGGRMKDFRLKYRSYDVIIIDDIQFLAGKEGTQEELFNTFNEYHQKNCQIVLTSDRPPQALSAFQERLKSRFSSGMIADISEPDLETRMAIIKAKLSEKKYNFDDNVIRYIATEVQKSVREIEGILNKIIVQYELRRIDPTIENVRDLITVYNEQNKKNVKFSPQQLIETVASFFDVTVESIKGVSRKKELVTPRQIAMYLLREELDASFPNIGSELGNRDHTTAMHSYQKIKTEVAANNRTKKDIEMIRERLYNGSYE